jgi:hypothetical protein
MSVSLSDMHNFVENLGSDIQMSSSIGNVIELGGDEDLGDNLGADLFSNSRVPSRPAPSGSGSGSSSVSVPPPSVPAFAPIDDIGITPLESIDTLSFDLPSASAPLPDVFVNRDTAPLGGYSDFGNAQSATGPSVQLAAASRMAPEEERRQKTELINKLGRLENKGFTLSKRFTMDNSLEEIQQEFDRLVDAKNLEASLRFQRQCLMGFVSGVEYLNGKFDPFGVELEGWGESVHEDIESFDEIFEQLYDKYKGRGTMAPEVKLVMALAGSGFMFHLSNKMFRNSKAGSMNAADIFKANPDLMRQFSAAAAQQAGPGFGNMMGAALGVPPQQPQQPQQPFFQPPNMPQPMAASAAPPMPRREMKGPSGMDDILKTFQEVRAAEVDPLPPVYNTMPPAMQQPAVAAMEEITSMHSGDVSDLESVRGGTRRGRRKAAAPVANTMTLNL